MKLNPKIFKQIDGETLEGQTFENTKIEFYALNQSPLYDKYIKQGRFVIWTSDGASYKVLIEEGYFDMMKEFYQKEVNAIWIEFLDRVGKASKRTNKLFIIPMMIIYVIAAVISSIYFPEQIQTFLISMIIVVFGVNFFQNKTVRNQIRTLNMETQQNIQQFLGVDKFNEIINKQQKHYNDFFNVNQKNEDEDNKDGQ
jgi:hypothetical protein